MEYKMTIKHIEEYRDPEISMSIVKRIKETSRKKVRLMEVCGTHTMSIFRNGIRALLPDTISLLSGPRKRLMHLLQLPGKRML
jgi:hydrogenase expression/formation protein HypD